MPTPTPPRWAHVKGDAKVPLRRGGWYKIVEATTQDIVVDIGGKRIQVSRRAVDLADRPDPAWSVVNAPSMAPRLPPAWGTKYAVCPSCRERAPLPPQALTELRCVRCNGLFAVEWGGVPS
jgi:hypothetical protein